ncbi:DsbA family protein [Elizabethkingia sp. HX WHF]|nr:MULTISPECIES: DsbA family protein [Elizabethkingia]MCL1638332.1 DsbA family protein [Elizabethkingia bruuniana]MDX8564719.1 DsbA family protein [Elizabethkingia sp. HX WHF]
MMKLIYIMDPLCGWCYGNSDNVLELFEKYKNEIKFEILPGGMWVGENVRGQSPQMVSFFLRHDAAVEEHTGIEFGNAYRELLKQEIVLDSEIPSRAIVTIQNIAPELTVPFMVAVQKARYYFGKDLNLDETYLSVAEDLGIDEQTFLDYFHSDKARRETQNTFQKAVQFAQSFPTMLVENNGKYKVIEQGYASLSDLQQRIEALKN